MTRRSKREIEQALNNLDTTDTDRPIDARGNVTASFVTYEEDVALDEEEIPDGWTASRSDSGEGEATFQVLERAADNGGESQ
jgi:hypothetical protein